MEPLAALWGGLAGAAVGSFVATAVLRHLRGEAWWRGRSHCPTCRRRLGAGELVPVVSRLWRPRCRSCGAPIDSLHTVAELAGAGVGALALAGGVRGEGVMLALFGWTLLGPALFDLRTRRLPDGWSLALATAGLLLAVLRGSGLALPAGPGPAAALGSAAAAGGALALLRALHVRLRRREGLGAGDVKFAAALATWMTPTQLPVALLVAAAGGLLHALAAGALRDPARPIPFGPHLALGAFLALGGGGG